MAKVSQSLQGMTDIEFPEVNIWQTLEARAREVMLQYDFREIRTPIVEMASVYLHSLGDTSEIVQKQMYAFETRGGKQVCLRPEGTAGVMRYVSNNQQELQDARLYYMGPMFRAERPQAGRKRQFHQLGVECIGSTSARQDAEVIALQAALFKAWNLDGVQFQLNTRGSMEDFSKILEGLRSELMPVTDDLCDDCRHRMDNNVLRVLDCKNPGCKKVVEELSPITTWMDPASVAYFEEVLATLDTFGVDYVVNPLLVRGLDYYQHSIWEVTSNRIGAQDALSGGGRYAMKANGKTIEGVGFGIGMERVLMALAEETSKAFSREKDPLMVLVGQNEAAQTANLTLLGELRGQGYRVRMDLNGKSMKAQMKGAGRQQARWVLIRGESELDAGTIQLRDMESGEQKEVAMADLVGEISGLV
ncbi:histidine--tRNA ligase [Kiritimatiellaeota bacterium B1221]|nr:histidine--tRNA ligase [Kiritimatiellaeota bacterium B1221]